MDELVETVITWGGDEVIFAFIYLITPHLFLFTVKDVAADKISGSDGQDEFDFIIVGAGSSGCVLADKLSEGGNFTVLVLEAGGYPSPVQSLPTLAYSMFNQPGTDWKYDTEPQVGAAKGSISNKMAWPSGKGFGGSSMINGMIYVRGNVQGFDDLAEKTGDKRWSLDNLLKYYKELENYEGWYNTGGDADQHGHEGLLSIQKSSLAPFVENLMRAGEELGYRERDPNPGGPNTEGFAKMDLYLTENGRRSDAYHNFLKPVMPRANLAVRRFSHVTEILFRPNTTVGVRYLNNGKTFDVKARKEVILSTGAIGTPQILMLSGIGPKHHLDELGIPTRLDLPVGEYLQDKYGAMIGPFQVARHKSLIVGRDLTAAGLLEWLKRGTGPLKTALSQATHAHISKSARLDNRISAPDVHTYILTIPLNKELEKRVQETFNWKEETLQFFAEGAKSDSFIQMVCLERPLGRGVVRLRNRSPLSNPSINPKYFQDERDCRAIVEGLQFAVDVVENTTAFADIDGHLAPIQFPACVDVPFKSTAYYECLARHVTVTAYKYSGTAPIGRDDGTDVDAVVDTRLRSQYGHNFLASWRNLPGRIRSNVAHSTSTVKPIGQTSHTLTLRLVSHTWNDFILSLPVPRNRLNPNPLSTTGGVVPYRELTSLCLNLVSPELARSIFFQFHSSGRLISSHVRHVFSQFSPEIQFVSVHGVGSLLHNVLLRWAPNLRKIVLVMDDKINSLRSRVDRAAEIEGHGRTPIKPMLETIHYIRADVERFLTPRCTAKMQDFVQEITTAAVNLKDFIIRDAFCPMLSGKVVLKKLKCNWYQPGEKLPISGLGYLTKLLEAAADSLEELELSGTFEVETSLDALKVGFALPRMRKLKSFKNWRVDVFE
ncbi:Glucose dehydrogenase [FAD, quinone] [Folsomia candida]|uniref:Glucose dehydrogenase [FAD, quinone] n=1 Tax=Folsomia candida TaxID=158441 RepID=A0A226D1K1_FOLCA|nr:Glucose dehydrogenase [FAD, quinone] [Folsomia candida]